MVLQYQGRAQCPSCHVSFHSAELLAVHLTSSVSCRDDLTTQNRIQLLSEYGSSKRLILTDSIYLVTEKGRGPAPDIVMMRAVSVLGELLDVGVWKTAKAAKLSFRERAK